MKLTIVSPVYPPELVVSGQISHQIAREAARGGWNVKVFTAFPNRPRGHIYPGYKRTLYKLELSQDGLHIVRCFTFFSRESSMVGRFLENFSFGLTSSLRLLLDESPDVVYSNSWPVVATGMLVLVGHIKHIPMVLIVQDMYPESLISQNRLPQSNLLIRLMCWMDGLIARHCSHLIVVSDQFSDIYAKKRRVSADRISVIPNWTDPKDFDNSMPNGEFRKREGIEDSDFLFVYGGNIGMAADVETTIKAMHLLVDQDFIKLLVAGEGNQLEFCQELAKLAPKNKVVFHTPWAFEETYELLRAADVLLLPTSNLQSLVSAPSKLISYMLAGKPILAAVKEKSDCAQIIDASGCGWIIEPDNPAATAKKIREIVNLKPAILDKMGDAGRKYALAHFTSEACLPRVMRLLEVTASQG